MTGATVRDPVVDGGARPTTVLFVPAEGTDPVAALSEPMSEPMPESMFELYAPGEFEFEFEFEVERVSAATDAVAPVARARIADSRPDRCSPWR